MDYTANNPGETIVNILHPFHLPGHQNLNTAPQEGVINMLNNDINAEKIQKHNTQNLLQS